ncbi:MAG: DUF933 domain-containing protein [Pirellulales bacterium]|jgi:ribosome-binding ATPase
MKIGLVGYQGSGKSSLFAWLTGVAADPAQAHTTQSAMAPIPDPRIDALCALFHPKKLVLAALEVVDTPGLSRTHEGNAARLSLIREADCLVVVVAGFAGSDPMAELTRFDEDLLLADMDLLSGRIHRLRESLKKPRPTRDQEQAELSALEPLMAALESGKSIFEMEMTEEQSKAIRSFRLLTEKPKLVLVNVADDEQNLERFATATTVPTLAVPVAIELELSRMSAEDRAEFEREMGLVGADRGHVLRTLLSGSGQILFFTACEKEVRSWLLRKGGTAVEAADGIHSDLARGFIRAETMHCDDLLRLGSEREVKAHHLLRSEPKDYVVQDGDVMHIRFSV